MTAASKHTPADDYVRRVVAADQHVPVGDLAAVPSGLLDRLVPNARQDFERLGPFAERLRARLGRGHDASQTREVAERARAGLQSIDQIGAGSEA